MLITTNAQHDLHHSLLVNNFAETVIVTLADYGGDYTALTQYQQLISKIEKEVASSYVKAICEKRMSFRNYEDRKNAAEQILDDTEKVC